MWRGLSRVPESHKSCEDHSCGGGAPQSTDSRGSFFSRNIVCMGLSWYCAC